LLPANSKKYPISFVVSTDRLSESGEHWVAVYYTLPGRGEFFDSYGRAPHALGFTIKRLPGIRMWNKTKLQALQSSVYEQYCIYYIAHRARGLRSSSAIFTPKRGFHAGASGKNDIIVKTFCSNNF
jgi:hypothetical protein